MTITSPAKINWFLHVLGKRDDGFHEIISPMQKISLYDTLTFEKSDGVAVTDDRAIPDNIIYKAVDVLCERRPLENRGVRITLKKTIPLSAGLGGGSSNAAATLTALNRLWNLGLTEEELVETAAGIGSDVPFFVNGDFALARGRGELLSPRGIEQSYDVLLINPGIEISSGWAYKNVERYVEIDNPDRIAEEFIDALDKRDFGLIHEHMFNSLESPVCKRYPVIKELKEDLRRHGARAALMSGSGSTVFGVFDDRPGALAAQERFTGKRLWTGVVRTLTRR